MISIIKSLHRLIGQNGIRLVPSILLSMLDSVLNSCMYGVMLFVLIDLSNGQFSAEGLKMCIIAVVIIFTLRCIVQGISFTQAQCVGPDVSHKLRISMGNHIRSLNLGFFTKNSIGKLSGTLLTDINDFETIITHCLCDVIKVTSLTILSLVIAFMLDWRFGLAVTLLVGIALPLLVISGKVSARNSDELRTANRTVVSRIVEYISGMRKKIAVNVECYLVPLFIAASKTADELTAAALTRGIENPTQRTCRGYHQISRIDIFIIILCVIIVFTAGIAKVVSLC